MSGAFRKGLIGALAFASLLTSVPVMAQQPRGQQPPAQPPAQPAPPAQPTIQLNSLRQSVQRLRDQERALAQEREKRFRDALQREDVLELVDRLGMREHVALTEVATELGEH